MILVFAVFAGCLQHQPPEVSMILHCRTFSMAKFLTHDGLAAGCMNKGYSSAGSTLAVWESILTNTEEALSLLASRMESDYLSLAPKMRRAYRQVELDSCMSFVFEFQP